MKLCKDCKWSKPDTNFFNKVQQIATAKCEHPNNMTKVLDLVSGEEAKVYRFMRCSSHREDYRPARYLNRSCGRVGIWFEEKK